MDPPDGSLDDSNNGPPGGAFFEDSPEEARCGADSWRLFEACLRLAPKEM